MDTFDNAIWRYKNFNMVNELDIAGEFIYDGIQKLNEMSCIEESASLFSFLYHISVGIERLQKIILVLCEKITIESYESFEKDLITHSHTELNRRISKFFTNKLNSKENEFLQVLTVFYKKARYNRFNVNTSKCEEEIILEKYIEKYLGKENIQYHFITRNIVVEENVRDLIGRVVGNISKKYYNFLVEKARENNTYCYELRAFSKAEKIFRSNNRKNSLQELKVTEMTALKELLICLRNTKESSAMLRYMDKIKPLDIDVELINEYIFELASGNISSSLIDEIETLYEEENYSVERMRAVGAIGDINVLFDMGEVFDSIQQIEEFINDSWDAERFAIEVPQTISKIDDEEIRADFYEILELCEKFVKKQIDENEFVDGLKGGLSKLRKHYNF